VRDRAFEPFFTTKPAGRGTGMGLSTVYGFVKQSHGHVTLDSTPGAGTTVTLYFPAIEAPGGAAAPNGSGAHPAVSAIATTLPAGLRVLLVEDDADVRRIAQSFLLSLGCAVRDCANASAALAELAQGHRFDLLFSDIRLGAGLDGHELAQRVVAHQPDIAVLLTSGYSHYLESGAGGVPLRWRVLQKPYEREALAQAITACIAGP
jgi:CheY-like chemotaxis protein